MREIKVTVSKDGKVQIETSGFTGASCKSSTQSLENRLGVSLEEDMKPEYYQHAEEIQNQ